MVHLHLILKADKHHPETSLDILSTILNANYIILLLITTINYYNYYQYYYYYY